MKEFPFWIFTCGFIKIVKINQFGVDVMNGSLFDFILTLGVKQRFLKWCLQNGASIQSALKVSNQSETEHLLDCDLILLNLAFWNRGRISVDLKILLSVWTMTSNGFADIKFKIFWRYFKDVSEEWFRFI